MTTREIDSSDAATSEFTTRTVVVRCTTCRGPNGPFVYMANGKDYCVACAQKIRDLMRFGSAGRRADDLHID